MSGENISVILNELKHLRNDITEIKESLKDKCNNCMNAATFRERLRSQWFNIVSLWGALAIIAGAFYLHSIGK